MFSEVGFWLEECVFIRKPILIFLMEGEIPAAVQLEFCLFRAVGGWVNR